jgi:hypothetical protein
MHAQPPAMHACERRQKSSAPLLWKEEGRQAGKVKVAGFHYHYRTSYSHAAKGTVLF